MTQAEVETTIKKVIAKHVDPREAYIFIFGSRALRRGRLNSDYDIGLYRGSKIPLAVIARIKDELEDYPIPVDVDLVDFASVSEDFKKLALKEIELWNTPKKNLKLI